MKSSFISTCLHAETAVYTSKAPLIPKMTYWKMIDFNWKEKELPLDKQERKVLTIIITIYQINIVLFIEVSSRFSVFMPKCYQIIRVTDWSDADKSKCYSNAI